MYIVYSAVYTYYMILKVVTSGLKSGWQPNSVTKLDIVLGYFLYFPDLIVSGYFT